MGTWATAGKPVYMVLRCEEAVFSLHVDRMDAVVEVDDADFERPADLDAYVRRALVRGVYKEESGLLMVLDVERVLELVS